MSTPTARETAAEARRAVHESLVGLPAWAADEARAKVAALEAAARTAALAETEAMIRASCFTHTPGTDYGWPDCHCAVADHLHLAATQAPTPTPTPTTQET